MTGPSSIVEKAAFERVGGYDSKIRLNCDLHWFYRLGAYFPIRFVNYVGVRKRIHPLNNTAVNPHYEFGVTELEDIRDYYPEVYHRIGKSVFNRKLGRKYFRLGSYYEAQGRLAQARQAYRKAMILRKLSFRYSWEYCRSAFFPVLSERRSPTYDWHLGATTIRTLPTGVHQVRCAILNIHGFASPYKCHCADV